MFAISATRSVFNYQDQRRQASEANAQIAAENRARLAMYENDLGQYYTELNIANTAWRDDVINTEIAIDDMLVQAMGRWAQTDQTIEQAFDVLALENVDLLKQMYKAGGARETTGVTAARLEGEAIRQYGHKLTAETQKAIWAQRAGYLEKELVRQTTNQARRKEWAQTYQPPVPGAPPPDPVFDTRVAEAPSFGSLLLEIGITAATSFITSKIASGDLFKGESEAAKTSTAKTTNKLSTATNTTFKELNTSTFGGISGIGEAAKRVEDQAKVKELFMTPSESTFFIPEAPLYPSAAYGIDLEQTTKNFSQLMFPSADVPTADFSRSFPEPLTSWPYTTPDRKIPSIPYYSDYPLSTFLSA